MKIRSFECRDFRNYEELSLEFSPGINILYGDNAQGKTNVLEALYLSCTSRSHRSKKDAEMIRFGADEAHVRTVVEKENIPHRIDIHLKKKGAKGIAIDSVPVRRASELFGLAHAVFFSPEDLGIVKNGPSERRRFLDMELCQIRKTYLQHLSSYTRVVNQRNLLLRGALDRPEDLDTLDAWDAQLIRYGTEIIRERRAFIERLNEIVGPIHRSLTGGTEELSLAYEPDVTEEDFFDKLLISRESDLRVKTTQCGPHRDDILFRVGDMDARRYGSQGQQRSAALSLKLAEIQIVRETVRETPVLFLDDVLSELDQRRQSALLGSIQDIQTLVTCTGLDDFVRNRFPMDRVFEVKEAKVTLRSS